MKETPAPIYSLRVQFHMSITWNGTPSGLRWPWNEVTPELIQERKLQLCEGKIVQSFPDGQLSILTDTGQLFSVHMCECKVLSPLGG